MQGRQTNSNIYYIKNEMCSLFYIYGKENSSLLQNRYKYYIIQNIINERRKKCKADRLILIYII